MVFVMDVFLPSVLDSTVDVLENSELILSSFPSDPDSTELPITGNLDLCLECEEDGGSISMQACSDFYLSHQFTENVQLAVSFPNPSTTSVFVEDCFSCTHCDSTFHKQKLLFKHLKETHNVSQSYTCDVCTYAATSSRLLSRHKVRKHSLSKVKKNIGNSTHSGVKVPLLSDKSFLPITCVKDTNDADIFVDRIKKVDGVVSGNMPTERQSFADRNVFLESSTLADNQMIKNVDIATISEPVKNIISNTHEEMVSSYADSELKTVIQDTQFRCNICSYASKSKRLLKYHTDSMHNPHRERFQCIHCSYSCKQKRTLDIHTAKQHSGGETVTCNQCHKQFFSSSALKRHLLVHTEEKLFVCSLNSCSKAFKTAGALGDHRRKVHNELIRGCVSGDVVEAGSLKKKDKKIICEFPGCGKAFRDKTNLRTHQCVHSGEKPLKCTLCSFQCVQKTSLSYHCNTFHKL